MVVDGCQPLGPHNVPPGWVSLLGDAGWGQATDPLKKEGRDVLRPKGAYAAMNGA